MRVVVYGAGAVGSILGGLVSLKNHDVVLVCRKAHADAIRTEKGLRIKSATGQYFAHVEAKTKLKAGSNAGCVFFTPKSNDSVKCADELRRVIPKDTPVVSFQNGVSNEEILAERFERVYGGVCMMTCSCLQPGQASFRKLGRVVVGRYPKGADPFAKKLGEMLEDSGFDTSVSKNIMCDKWRKLVVNLQSAFNAIIDTRDHDSIEFMDLKIGVLEEAERVLKADKITARSCEGRDLSVDEIIAELKKPRAPRSSSAVRVNNSTWQNLYLKRKTVENGYFHDPIIERAGKHGIPVPYNKAALELVTTCARKGTPPGAFRAAEVLDDIKKRTESH